MSLFRCCGGIILFFAAIMHLVHILHVVLVTRSRVDPDKKDAYTVSAYATQARAIHKREHTDWCTKIRGYVLQTQMKR